MFIRRPAMKSNVIIKKVEELENVEVVRERERERAIF